MGRPTAAFVSANLFELGLGYVLFTRFRGGDAESGVFLVDVYCQGVKDAFYSRVSEFEYNDKVLDRIVPPDNRRALDPPAARKLVEDAVAYARRLGFAPHAEHKHAGRVFGGTDPADATATFTFGMDGKSFYIQGKYDSLEKCLRILSQLRTRCGEDGFDFMVIGGESVIRELGRQGFTIRQKVPVPPEDSK